MDMTLDLDMDMESLGMDIQEHNQRGICMPNHQRSRRCNAWLV